MYKKIIIQLRALAHKENVSELQKAIQIKLN